MSKKAILIDEADEPILQALLTWWKQNSSIGQNPLPADPLSQEAHGIVAFAPAGGIQHADATTGRVYGSLCNLYRETYVSVGVRQLEKITNPDGSDHEEYVFHLDPTDDVPQGKPLITFPTKWGTRYALWESCNTWENYYTYY